MTLKLKQDLIHASGARLKPNMGFTGQSIANRGAVGISPIGLSAQRAAYNPGTMGSGAPKTSGFAAYNPGTMGSGAPKTSGFTAYNPGTMGSGIPKTSGFAAYNPGTMGSGIPKTSGFAAYNPGVATQRAIANAAYSAEKLPDGVKATTYTDPNGVASNGYNIGGKTYTDSQGKNRVAAGSTVTTADGKTYVSGANSGMQMQQTSGSAPGTFTYNGKTYQGYIKNGVTYIDPNYTQTVPVGASVYTNGGVYNKHASGSSQTYDSIYNNWKSSTQNAASQYNDSLAARQAAIDAATDIALSKIRSQTNKLYTNNRNNNAEAYTNYLFASNPYGPLAQRNAALGLGNSGYAESSMVALGNSYQQAMQKNQAQLQEQLFQLDQAATQAVAAGERDKYLQIKEMQDKLLGYAMQNAQFGANLAMRGTDAVSDEDFRQWQMRNQIDQTNYNRQMDQENLAIQQQQIRYNQAVELLDRGITTEQLARQMGVSYEEAKGYVKRYLEDRNHKFGY